MTMKPLASLAVSSTLIQCLVSSAHATSNLPKPIRLLEGNLTMYEEYANATDPNATTFGNDTMANATAVTPISIPRGLPVNLYEILPDYTQEALIDPMSPQSMAYLFLNYDPNIDIRTEEELLQRFALATLYHGLGRSWTNGNPIPSDDECEWFADTGSGCNGQGGMEMLLLGNNNMEEGPIPPEVGLLTLLKQLDLSANFISGTIPTYLGQLQVLESLNLSGNEHMTGTIPTELASLEFLQTIDLTGLNLTGVVPEVLCGGESLLFDCQPESLCGCDCTCTSN